MEKFKAENKRTIKFLFLILFIGAIIGSIFSNFIGFVLPEGVVKDFFLINKPFGWNPFTMNLQILTITTGFSFNVSVCSLIGIFMAWYFLRYFK